MISRYEKAIFIIGSTAVGKTKLGIDLALHVNGEIISSDSMQLYQKASLMTAKPNLEEQSMVKHHLIDFLPITTTDFTVRDYQRLALNAVDDITSRGKTPLIVGGTMYYIESLLYDRTFTPGDCAEPSENENLLEKIREIDEKYDLDTKNPRRLRNNYNYIVKTGCKPSEKPVNNQLRFTNSFVIWLHCDNNILENRVRKRISEMIQQGGLREIEEIMAENHSDYTKGVLQSIGYKEFESYFKDPATLQVCIDNLITKTMQYSKKQIRWIKNRMQPYLNINVINTDHAEDWENIKGQGILALNSDVNAKEVVIKRVEVKNCEKCGVSLNGRSEWEQHLKSRRHKKNIDLDFSDDEESRKCEICQKELTGKKNWVSHVKSRKHLRKVRNDN